MVPCWSWPSSRGGWDQGRWHLDPGVVWRLRRRSSWPVPGRRSVAVDFYGLEGVMSWLDKAMNNGWKCREMMWNGGNRTQTMGQHNPIKNIENAPFLVWWSWRCTNVPMKKTWFPWKLMLVYQKTHHDLPVVPRLNSSHGEWNFSCFSVQPGKASRVCFIILIATS